MFDLLYTNGDSWTYGSELLDPAYKNNDAYHPTHVKYRQDHHWPNILAQKLGVNYIDSSFPGASNDRILRTSMLDLSRLVSQGRRPIAVIAWTQLHRFELAEPGGSWRSFVGPADTSNPKLIGEIWSKWSSDYGDVVRWMVQLISFHSFCKLLDVPVLGLTVFSSSYRLFEDYMSIKELDGYKTQLHNICNLTEQALNPSLESILKPYTNISYGPGGHPLELGHKTLGNYIATRITKQIKT